MHVDLAAASQVCVSTIYFAFGVYLHKWDMNITLDIVRTRVNRIHNTMLFVRIDCWGTITNEGWR